MIQKKEVVLGGTFGKIFFINAIIKLFCEYGGTYMDLSEKLKLCRNNCNLTQADVASKLHISRKTISGWENAHRTPDLNSLVKLSHIYHVSIDAFILDQNLYQNDPLQLKKMKIYRRAYRLNIILIPLLYLEFFRPFGLHCILIPVLASINCAIFVSYFPKPYIFKNSIILLKTILFFIFAYVFNVFATLINNSSINSIHSASTSYFFGFAMGRLILVFLISLCLSLCLLNKAAKKAL